MVTSLQASSGIIGRARRLPGWSAQAAALRGAGWLPLPPSGSALSRCILLHRLLTTCPHGEALAYHGYDKANQANVFFGNCAKGDDSGLPPHISAASPEDAAPGHS